MADGVESKLTENFKLILKDNNWESEKSNSPNVERDNLFLENLDLNFSKSKAEKILLANCEFLIASDGSILLCSNQVGECLLTDLPHNFIIYGKTSQLIENLDEGLSLINKKHSGNIPTGITTLKTFKENIEDDYLSYGSIQKNLYLLLLEDL